MATPPFSIDASAPANDMKIAQFPGNERTFRDIVKSWFETFSDPTTGLIDQSKIGTTLTITSTDDGANTGPTLFLDRNSASPAVSDNIGILAFRGRNAAAASVQYASIFSRLVAVGDGVESGSLRFIVRQAGSNLTPMVITGNTVTIAGTLTVTG